MGMDSECDKAFQCLKEKLVTPLILGYPDVNGEMFVLDTDASNDSIGAVLSQIQDGKETVIAYASRTLSSAEKNYCVTRKEMLALVYFVKHFKQYLLGREFLLRTDHGSLVWLHKFKEPDGQIARWIQQLGPYNFRIEHRPGKRHENADALSRINSKETVNCKQCKMDVTIRDEFRGVMFKNSEDLRKMCIVTCDSHEDEDCGIVKLIYPDNDNTVGCISTKTNRKVRKDKKMSRANRPPRAKPREQPLMELTNERIRKHQINDEGLAEIIRLIENNSNKPAINSVSNKNF